MYDVLIIGSGPAGYTAAIYTSRALLKTLILSGPVPGGQLTTTTEVENFPGFPAGIKGPQLLSDMRAQAERFGVEVVIGEVTHLDVSSKPFTVTADGKEYRARSVIIATGASAKRLGIPSEETFRGKGISYCATCDGFFFRGKHVAVLGGGDTAMEEATFLATLAAKVTLIHRRDTFRASPIMVEKARKNPKIEILTNKSVVSFSGDTAVRSVDIADTLTGETASVPVDGVFVAIGHEPATGFLRGIIALDTHGYVTLAPAPASEAKTATSVPGIFAAGDCTDPRYRQGVVAAGWGAMAALDAQRYLESES